MSLRDVFEGTTTELGDFSVGQRRAGLVLRAARPAGGQYQSGASLQASLRRVGSPPICRRIIARPRARGTFYDNFATDTSLNAACWSTSGAAISQLGSTFGALNATYSDPDLDFINGMEMTSGGQEGADFSGLQSTYAYSAPFDFETTVSGTASGDSAFSVYLVGGDSAGVVGVEGNLNPSNGADYGIWDNQESLPAGNGFAGSEDLIADAERGHAVRHFHFGQRFWSRQRRSERRHQRHPR